MATTIGFEDAPVPPTDDDKLTQILDLELEGLGGRVVTTLKNKQQLSEEEAKQLNATLRTEVRITFDSLAEKICKSFEFQPGDDPHLAEIKVHILQLYVGFMARLGVWLLNKIHAIVSEINEFFQWCWQKTQELFQYVRSILNISTTE